MPTWLLLVLNGVFFALHTVLIFFNVFGWIPKKTRRLNLICLALTGFSWFVMGLWHGVGYCILTDWHWQIRRALEIDDGNQSYLQLLVAKTTGWNAPDSLVAPVAGAAFAISVLASATLNGLDWRSAVAAKRQNADLSGPR